MEQSIIRLYLMWCFLLLYLFLHKLKLLCTHYNDMIVSHGEYFWYKKEKIKSGNKLFYSNEEYFSTSLFCILRSVVFSFLVCLEGQLHPWHGWHFCDINKRFPLMCCPVSSSNCFFFEHSTDLSCIICNSD